MIKCVKCGWEQSDEANFCMKCGARIEKKTICPKCNKELPEGSAFCMFCGTPLKKIIPDVILRTDNELPVIDNELPVTDNESPITDNTQHSDDIVNQREEKVTIQDDTYTKVLRTYLKAAILDELSERLTGYKVNNTSISKMICAAEYKTLIDENWGDYKNFEKECLEQKYNELGYSYDVDHGTIKACFRSLYDVASQKNAMYRLGYNVKDAIDFIAKQQIVEASYFNFIDKSLLSEADNSGKKELVPGKAADYIKSAEIFDFLADAIKCDDSSIPYIGSIKPLRDYQMPNSYVWMDGCDTWTNQITKACYIKDEYIYYFEKERVNLSWDSGFNICRFNLRTGVKEVLQPAQVSNAFGMGCIFYNERFPLFSILQNRIYYPSSGRVLAMNLDGSDVAPVHGFEKEWKIDGGISGVWAFPGGMLIYASDGLYRLLYDVDSKPVKILADIQDLMDFSDREIVTKSGKVIDIRTKEKEAINKIYPGLGDNSPLLIDSSNGIAYYYKKSDACGFADKIIGTDKTGKVVNVWNMPLFSDKQKKLSGYDSLVFNGVRMMAKFTARAIDKGYCHSSSENEAGCAAYIAEYDHLGFENIVYQMDKISFDTEYCFGEHHYIYGNMNIVLMGVNRQKHNGSYWLTAITHHGAAIPFDKFN